MKRCHRQSLQIISNHCKEESPIDRHCEGCRDTRSISACWAVELYIQLFRERSVSFRSVLVSIAGPCAVWAAPGLLELQHPLGGLQMAPFLCRPSPISDAYFPCRRPAVHFRGCQVAAAEIRGRLQGGGGAGEEQGQGQGAAGGEAERPRGRRPRDPRFRVSRQKPGVVAVPLP